MSGYFQGKTQKSNSTELNLKQLAADFDRVNTSDIFGKIAKLGSYEKLLTQQQESSSPHLPKNSSSKTRIATKQSHNLSFITSNPFTNKTNLNQSFTCIGASSSSTQNPQSRSKSSLNQKYSKPTLLNESQNSIPSSDLQASFLKLPKSTLKKDPSSLNKTLQDSFSLVGNSELDISHSDLNLSHFGYKGDPESTPVKNQDSIKPVSGYSSAAGNGVCESLYTSFENECDKKVREIVQKYQLRDAMHRKEITHLRKSNEILQSHIKKLEHELYRYKKKREKDFVYIQSLEKELQKLTENEKNREKEMKKYCVTTDSSFSQDKIGLHKNGGSDKENELTKYDQLNQRIETLASEKFMLENMLKNVLLNMEKTKFQHCDPHLSKLPSKNTQVVASECEALFLKSNNSNTPLQPKNLNTFDTLGADEQSSGPYNLVEKGYYQPETPIITTCSDIYKTQNSSIEAIGGRVQTLGGNSIHNTKENKPNDHHTHSSFAQIPKSMQHLPTSNWNRNHFHIKNDDGVSHLEAACYANDQGNPENELDLETCSGRISPQKMVLRNVKQQSENSLINGDKSPSKYDVSKLRLDLSKIHQKKNY